MKKMLALILILIGVAWIIPAYFTLQASFLGTFTSPLNLIGRGHLGSWRILPWRLMGKWTLNSAIICVSASVLSALVCISAGYGFVGFEFPGKEKLFYLFLLAMALPGIVLFLPRYLLIARFNLIGSYIGLILPVILLPALVFFARQYLVQFDVSIIEAARLDGASEFQIFRRIILPLSKPLIVLCLFTGFGASYGDFMWQYLVGRDIRTLTSGVGLFLRGSTGADTMGGPNLLGKGISVESLKAATAVLQASPLVVLFALGQKYIVRGTKI